MSYNDEHIPADWHPQYPPGKAYHRVQCAAIRRECQSFLMAYTDDMDSLLRMNGWRLGQGFWICPRHDEHPQ